MGVIGDEVERITSASEFSQFVTNVNSGTADYRGTTVLLDSDLSLSEITAESIGKDYRNFFSGVFDGQGHVISGLTISDSSSKYTGLFGYSRGLTIRNVVLDSSCSITDSYSGTGDICIGGIIGDCEAGSGQCSIENNVNMADVTFSGAISRYTYLEFGGIAGYLYSPSSSSYSIHVKNCVNYGSVTHTGGSNFSYIGGFVGRSEGSSTIGIRVQNCLNYGTITHSGISTKALNLGGIAGYSEYTHIENCVSAGKISAQNTPTENSYIGGIIGYVSSSTHIKYSYYTSDVETDKLYDYGTPTGTEGITETPTSVDSTLIDSLNNQASVNSWNKWLLNEDSKSVSFIINYDKDFTVKSQVILLPDLVDNSEHTFSGWYKDVNLTKSFTPDPIDSDTTLYGMFCGSDYTVALDVNGGNASSIPSSHPMAIECNGYYGYLPEGVTREGYTFDGWFTEEENGKKIESTTNVTTSSNHVLYAHWLNIYTVTFNATGGSVSITSMNVTFSHAYSKLPDDATRDGYDFNGWFTDVSSGTEIKEGMTVETPDHHTLYAHWTAKEYTVTFDVNGGDSLSETESSKTVTFDEEYGELPEDVTREGYNFDGWFTDVSSGTEIKEGMAVETPDHHTLYAHWTAKEYTVFFYVSDGVPFSGHESTKVTFNSEYGELPKPTKEGYNFDGWFTKEDGGTEIKEGMTVETPDDHNLYAHWTEDKAEPSGNSPNKASTLYPLIQIFSLLI